MSAWLSGTVGLSGKRLAAALVVTYADTRLRGLNRRVEASVGALSGALRGPFGRPRRPSPSLNLSPLLCT